MTTITIGTRVTFAHRTTYRPYIHTVTGTVVDLLPWTPCALAYVELDSGLMPKLVSVDRLCVVEGQDDAQDYLATHPEPFRLLCEDYEFATGEAGNLGGTEI